MLKKLSMAAASATIATLTAVGSAQAQIDITLLDVYGDFDGDTLFYDFQGLPQAADDGVLRLFTGVSQTTPFDGLDLTGSGDFFNLIIDGNNVGSFSCDGNLGSTLIPGCTPSGANNQFDVSFNFSDLGLDLPSLVDDGSLLVEVDFNSNVNFSSQKDELFVQLTYEEAVSTPEPASLFALFGIGALGVTSLKRKQKEKV